MLKAVLSTKIFGYGLKERGLVLLITLVVVGVALVFGKLLDARFGSGSIYTLLAVFVSFPVTQAVLFFFFKKRSAKGVSK